MEFLLESLDKATLNRLALMQMVATETFIIQLDSTKAVLCYLKIMVREFFIDYYGFIVLTIKKTWIIYLLRLGHFLIVINTPLYLYAIQI